MRKILLFHDKIMQDDEHPVLTAGYRRFQHKVFYGYAARLERLHSAGAASAKILIPAIDHREASLKKGGV